MPRRREGPTRNKQVTTSLMSMSELAKTRSGSGSLSEREILKKLDGYGNENLESAGPNIMEKSLWPGPLKFLSKNLLKNSLIEKGI